MLRNLTSPQEVSCLKQLLQLISVLLICEYTHLSDGRKLSNITQEIGFPSQRQQGREEVIIDIDQTSSIRNPRESNIQRRSIIDLLLLNAIQDKFETSILHSKNDTLTDTSNISTEADESSTNSRIKRDDECSSSLRRRSICPWEYEYFRNDTLHPPLIKTISCHSGETLMSHMIIQCHQLYSYKLFKMRNCENNVDNSCFVKKRVKSGCLAAFPCMIHTSD